jgi:hypothetical protein
MACRDDEKVRTPTPLQDIDALPVGTFRRDISLPHRRPFGDVFFWVTSSLETGVHVLSSILRRRPSPRTQRTRVRAERRLNNSEKG